MFPKTQIQKKRPVKRKPFAVRLINEVVGEIELYIAIWGNPDHRDEYGTYFDRAAPPDMALDFLPFPLMYEHGGDALVGKAIIGTIYKVWFDDVGIAARATLDRTSPYFGRFVQEITDEELRVSSGSAEHVATFDSEGRFVTWYLTEVSLTKTPAEHMIPFVKLVRSTNGCVMCDYDASDAGRDAPNGAIHSNPQLQTMYRMSLGVPMKTRLFEYRRNNLLVAMDSKQAINALRATRAVYDEQGNELDPQTAIAMLIQDGVAPEDLIALIQELIQPQDELADQERDTDAPDVISPAPTPGNNPAPQGQPQFDLNAMGMQLVQQQFEDFLAQQQGNRAAPNQRANNANRQVTVPVEMIVNMLAQANQRQEGAPPRDRRSTVTPRQQPQGSGQQRQQPQQPPKRNFRLIDKFAGISAPALALGALIMRANGDEPSDEYCTALLYKASKYVEDKKLSERDDYVIRARMPDITARDVMSTDKSYIRSQIVPIRADEVMNPGQVDDGSGGNTASAWVDDFQGADVWYKLRETPGLYNTMRSKGMEEGEIPAGFKGLQINLEGIDFAFYTTAAAEDWDSSSGNVTPRVTPSRTSNPTITLSVGKLSALAAMAQELIEDSIVPQLEEAQRKLGVQIDEKVQKILINGDTTLTANTNINLSDGTPTNQDYLLFNGLLYTGLVAQAGYDANNVLDEDLFNEVYALLPDEHMEDERLLFVYDKRTMLNARRLPSVLTRDVNSQATIENGRLVMIWGVDIQSTSFLKPAHTTGKLTPSTAANHTQGRLLLIRPDQTIFAYKRRPSIEIVRDAIADATQIVVHMRAGFKVRDNDAVKAAYDIKTVDSA